MNLKNIILNTAELGPVLWDEVEKLQPSEKGFIFFISSKSHIVEENGNDIETLTGVYILTNFSVRPTYKELINYIISNEYPDGKESQMLRLGVQNLQNEEYLEYFNNVELICSEVKSLLV